MPEGGVCYPITAAAGCLSTCPQELPARCPEGTASSTAAGSDDSRFRRSAARFARPGIPRLFRRRPRPGVHAVRVPDDPDPVRASSPVPVIFPQSALSYCSLGLRARRTALIFTIAGVIAGARRRRTCRRRSRRRGCFGVFAGAVRVARRCRCSASTNCSCRVALAVRSWPTCEQQANGGSLTGVAIMGALSALIVGPCVTPPLAVAVLYISADAQSATRRLCPVRAGPGHGRAAGRVRHECRQSCCRARAPGWMRSRRVFGVSFLAPGHLDALAHPRRRLDHADGRCAIRSPRAVYLRVRSSACRTMLPAGASLWKARRRRCC